MRERERETPVIRKRCLRLRNGDDHLLLDLLSLGGELGDVGTLDLAEHGLSDDGGDLVWVAVGGGAAVLEVTLVLGGDGARDADRGAAVGDAPGELVVGGGLVLAGHAELVVLAVDGHVLGLAGGELLHGSLDGLHAALLTGLLGGDVGVETSTVPIAGDGLGSEGDLGTELLSNAVKNEAGHPELVAHGDVVAGTNLVFPLSGHDFSVGAGDVDVGVQAGLVVSLDDVTAEDLAGTYTAVVGTLRSREAVLGPAIGPAELVEKSVLLLETEPELVLLVRVEDDSCIVTEVVRVGRAVRHVGLAHDQDIVAETEGVGVECDRAEVDIRVVAGSLTRRRTVKVPFWEVVKTRNLLGESLDESLASMGESGSSGRRSE